MTTGSLILNGDATRIPLADSSVDLVCGSPPYAEQRTYDDGTLPAGRVVAMTPDEWIRWMLVVTTEAVRVSRGAVVWVIGCPTRDRNYLPIAEALMVDWWRSGGSAYRPVYWRRQGVPGSGGDQWFRGDVEYCLCFKRPGRLPWTDNTACGWRPKYRGGGACTNRLPVWTDKSRRVDGRRRAKAYAHPKLANPGNLMDTGTGGRGHMGSLLSHDNEAPYPEKLPERFIRSLCPPNGIVFDPFSGSGTTAKVARTWGRRAIAMDLRMSQCELTRRRLKEVPETLFAHSA